MAELYKIKSFLLDLFFPKFCLGCQKEGAFLCDDCKSILEILEHDYCLCNKKPFRLPPDKNKNGKCSRCSDKKLAGLYFALPYKEKSLTRKLIHQFKYSYIKSLAKPLASLLVEHFVITGKNKDEIWKNSILVPVPLYKTRLKNRGYNQSEELAKELAKVLKIPVVSDVLIKIKDTRPQAESKKEEREKNLFGVFAINPVRKRTLFNGVKNPSEIIGKKVFLVDDVYTTGSTLNECARVLKDAGAKSVWGICIAREG